jgi:hypothetical protein
MDYKEQTFTGEVVNIDDNKFEECSFVRCKVIYAGAERYALSHCTFDACAFSLEGPAQNPLNFMALLYREGGSEGQNFVEDIFNQIKRGSHS